MTETRVKNQIPNPDLILFLEAPAEILTFLPTPSEGQRHYPPCSHSSNHCPQALWPPPPDPHIPFPSETSLKLVLLEGTQWDSKPARVHTFLQLGIGGCDKQGWTRVRFGVLVTHSCSSSECWCFCWNMEIAISFFKFLNFYFCCSCLHSNLNTRPPPIRARASWW